MYNLAQMFNIVDPEVFGVVEVRGDEDVDVPRARMKEVLFVEENSRSGGVLDVSESLVGPGPGYAQVWYTVRRGA
jgi:hypothetical protein